MKVLLTGASGFLGRHVIQKLSQGNVNIVAIKRRTSRIDHLKSYPIVFIEGDIRDEACLDKAMKGVDVVIHAVGTKMGRWEDFYAENVESTERLLQLSIKSKVKRFIFISSIDVYDHTHAKNGSILTENTPKDPNPPNHYSRSKIEAEALVERYCKQHNVPTVIIRPGCIYGIGGNWYPARLGFTAGANRYALLGNGKSAVPLSHTSSVVDLIWRSIQNEKAVGKSYNVLEDAVIKRLEFLKLAKSILFPNLKMVRVPLLVARPLAFTMRSLLKMIGRTPPTRLHPKYMRLFALSVFYANDRAKEDLGWEPVGDVRKTMEEMLKWHRARKDKSRSEMLIPELPVRIRGDGCLNVGLIGCGAFANMHLTILDRISQVVVTSVCDPDLEAARSMARRFQIQRVYVSLAQMLEEERIDVVHVVSPTQTHADLSIQAMKKGCHVLVEKPMAVDAKEARHMVQVAEKQGVKLCVEHSLLYHPTMIQARKMIQKGLLGKIVQIESGFGTSFSSNIGSPFLQYEAKGAWVYGLPGALFQDFMPHPLSVLLDLMGSVNDVVVRAKYNKIVPHMKVDELRILLENESILGTLSLSFGATPRHSFLNIYGTHGTVKADFMTGTPFIYKDMGMLPKFISRNMMGIQNGRRLIKASRKNLFQAFSKKRLLVEGHDNLIRLFYRSILHDEALPVTHQNSLKTMEIMDQIWSQIKV